MQKIILLALLIVLVTTSISVARPFQGIESVRVHGNQADTLTGISTDKIFVPLPPGTLVPAKYTGKKVIAGMCLSPMISCGGKCVDTSSDANNCGSCGHNCGDAKAYCQNGICMCRGGLTYCGVCTDLGSDVNNCGGCGEICPYGWVCNSGTCSPDIRSVTNKPLDWCNKFEW
jgi:hypothetical protein